MAAGLRDLGASAEQSRRENRERKSPDLVPVVVAVALLGGTKKREEPQESLRFQHAAGLARGATLLAGVRATSGRLGPRAHSTLEPRRLLHLEQTEPLRGFEPLMQPPNHEFDGLEQFLRAASVILAA